MAPYRHAGDAMQPQLEKDIDRQTSRQTQETYREGLLSLI